MGVGVAAELEFGVPEEGEMELNELAGAETWWSMRGSCWQGSQKLKRMSRKNLQHQQKQDRVSFFFLSLLGSCWQVGGPRS